MSKDEREAPRTLEERVMRRLLDGGAACSWETTVVNNEVVARKIVYDFSTRLDEFSEMMMRRSSEGYVLGAGLFCQKMTAKNVERAVRSHLLTKLARSLHDHSFQSTAPITEPEVAMFGHFVTEIIGEHPEMLVDWAEDMNVDDPKNDFKKQPTAVIRGVFLSSAVIHHKDAVRFWELASRSKLFPFRMFSNPCDPKHGELFAPFHVRAYSTVFATVSAAAVERFARYMRLHARTKLINESVGEGKWRQRLLRASRSDRRRVFKSIADGIPAVERRQEVAALLGVAGE